MFSGYFIIISTGRLRNTENINPNQRESDNSLEGKNTAKLRIFSFFGVGLKWNSLLGF